MKRFLAIAAALLPVLGFAQENREHVILVHGLCRTSRSMIPLEKALWQAGFEVSNLDYPSRSDSIEKLSESALGQAVADCQRAGAVRIHFVTHSLGGILVREYLTRHPVPNLGRVVMLAPPNQGSEVVDRLASLWVFEKIGGPAGRELGTAQHSTPNKLGRASFSVGVIAGNRSINWINSLLIPGSDDGKVSVDRTRLAGMTDHIVLRATHPFIMRNRTAIQQAIRFLNAGRFDQQPPVAPKRTSSARDKDARCGDFRSDHRSGELPANCPQRQISNKPVRPAFLVVR